MPTLDQIQAEKARRRLHEFVRQAWPIIEPSTPFVDNWHIGAICEHLEAVSCGQIPKLLINVPPGCSKSLQTCVFWPCWEWASDPSVRWFFASYDARLSTRDSVRCRTLLESDWYRSRWPVTFRADQNLKTYYETTAGGYRLATSVGGHGTGEHPDRIVVDDPHKVTEAESDLERQTALDWWDHTMSTRGVSRGARRVIIMQRLHTRDLSGHVLEQGGWVHLCLPMRHEPGRMTVTSLGWQDPRREEGELLSPQQFDADRVASLERVLGARAAAGQLQQRPAPREGAMFQRPWFERLVEAAPRPAVARVRYWDKAGTEGGAGACTCGVLMARSLDGLYYVEDVVRGRWSAGQRNAVIRQTAALDAQRYGPFTVAIWIEQEPGSGGKESAEISVRELAGHIVHVERPSGSKEVRAEPFAAQCEVGNVLLVRGEWNGEYIEELCLFPAGARADQVDASSGAFNKLALADLVEEDEEAVTVYRS